ncbi:hypothetical protein [Streptomyces sp. NPDC017673]|uniref:hypothetical protein n=1 Tax=unclassified Streptomyces TaxID=2593676 RepID=UPI0037A27776
MNVEGLYPQDKRGKTTVKGRATEWIHWQSGAAQLLPRLIARRTRGPLFLTDHKGPDRGANVGRVPSRPAGSGSPTAGPKTSSKRTPGSWPAPLAPPEDVEDLGTAGYSTGPATAP